MINKFFELSYNYYQMYYYVVVIVLVLILIWKKSRINSVAQQSVIYCIAFVLAFGAAAVIKEQYILKDTVEIYADYPDGAQCTLQSASFGVFKKEYNLKLEQGINLADIPAGMNRVLKIYSQEECTIGIKFENSEDSFTLEGADEETKHDIPLYSDTRKIYLICEMLIKAVLTALLALAISAAVTGASAFMLRISFEKIKYELIIFAFFAAQLILFMPSEIEKWVNAWYVLNYKDGIGSRLLIGSLINLFCPDYVTAKFAYNFAVAGLLILCLLVSILFGQFIRKSGEMKSTLYFTAFYMACPGSITHLAIGIGRLETYSFILCLLCVILFEKIKDDHIKYMSAAAGLYLSLLVHQGTLFLYCPILMTLIIHDLTTKFNMRKAVSTLVYTGGGILIFVYLQIYSKLRYLTCDEAFQAVSARTDMQLDYHAVRLEYYSSLGENFEYGQKYFFEYYDVCTKLFVSFMISLPLIIFIAGIWKSSFDKSGIKLIKNPQFWVVLTNMAFIPIYVIMCDWGRWTSALIGVLFFQIAYLMYKNDAGMRKTFEHLDVFVKNNPFFCMAVLVYLSSLEKVVAIFGNLIYKVSGYIR